MTAANLAAYIGCVGDLHATALHAQRRGTDSLIILVHILDARTVRNRTYLLVTPVAGRGKQWIVADWVHNITEGRAPGGTS